MMLLAVLAVISFASATPVKPDADWRVVGGANAEGGQYPYIVSLRTSTNSHTCGGSLIRNDWVITAAHCVVNSVASSLSIVAGTNQLNSFSGIQVRIARIVVHPDYNDVMYYNDIALLQLQSAIVPTNLIRTIEPETEYNNDVRDSVLIGWGRTAVDGSLPNDLQHINLRTITNELCFTAWSGSFVTILPSQICTFTTRGEGACNGDSGGPLIAEIDGVAKLIGLVSFGSPCARGLPDVYTRVNSFGSWINQTIN